MGLAQGVKKGQEFRRCTLIFYEKIAPLGKKLIKFHSISKKSPKMCPSKLKVAKDGPSLVVVVGGGGGGGAILSLGANTPGGRHYYCSQRDSGDRLSFCFLYYEYIY